MLMMQAAAANPMSGLPVAGKDSTIGDPYKYGQFQNFLPEPLTEGPNPMATGLRPDMFQYRKPGSGAGADPEIQQLRDQLAQVQAGGAGAAGGTGYTPKYLPGGGLDPNDPGNIAQFYRLTSGVGATGAQQPHPFANQLPTDVGGGG
jgi:hypothetical protein